jgi:hypothetical protein
MSRRLKLTIGACAGAMIERMPRTFSIALGCIALVTIGCGQSDDAAKPNPPTSTVKVGPVGGTLSVDGCELTIPAGALDATRTLSLTKTTDPAPSGVLPHSPLYRFEPEGLEFAKPAEVSIRFAGEPTEPAIYWTESSGKFARIGGSAKGNWLTASVTHFSEGYVGSETEGDGGTVDSGTVVDSGAPDAPTSCEAPLMTLSPGEHLFGSGSTKTYPNPPDGEPFHCDGVHGQPVAPTVELLTFELDQPAVFVAWLYYSTDPFLGKTMASITPGCPDGTSKSSLLPCGGNPWDDGWQGRCHILQPGIHTLSNCWGTSPLRIGPIPPAATHVTCETALDLGEMTASYHEPSVLDAAPRWYKVSDSLPPAEYPSLKLVTHINVETVRVRVTDGCPGAVLHDEKPFAILDSPEFMIELPSQVGTYYIEISDIPEGFAWDLTVG